MIDLEDKLVEEYIAECREHLDSIGTGLLAIENGRAEIDEALIDRVFRATHSIGKGAVLFDLVKIGDLARRMEDVLALIRSGKIAPAPDSIGVLLRATDQLQLLIESPDKSNQADTSGAVEQLAKLQAGKLLRVLLVEDDFASRLMMQAFLSRYGECHVAVNGREAVDAFRASLERGASEREYRYDLICMDIMMPEMDGTEAVRRVRALEEAAGISSTRGAKIIMTTAVDDIKEVSLCYNQLCDAYLLKPIGLAKLLSQMQSWQLAR
jgi:two-component system chemotaxis response regulator CheY